MRAAPTSSVPAVSERAALPPEGERPPAAPPSPGDSLGYWLGLPLRWGYQMAHNGLGIARVLDLTRFRPMPAGLITPDHPWATGLDPASGRPIWHRNVLYRSRRDPSTPLPADEDVVT